MDKFLYFTGQWVGFGAISGGLISGVYKVMDIFNEPEPVYENPNLERPIRGVYHISRVAGSAGFGAGIAGLTALTAPISIPIYIYYKNYYNKNK